LRLTQAGSYNQALRRVFAILLIALFSFSLISPALSADSDSNLPACCRRTGKHHCAAMSGADQTSSSGQSLKSGDRCPLFLGSILVATGIDAFIPIVSLAKFAPTTDHDTIKYISQSSGSTSPRRSHPKRGPPPSPSFA